VDVLRKLGFPEGAPKGRPPLRIVEGSRGLMADRLMETNSYWVDVPSPTRTEPTPIPVVSSPLEISKESIPASRSQTINYEASRPPPAAGFF
jgi:hypothetical protein